MFEKSVARRQHKRRQVVLGLGVIAGLIQQAYAQEAPAAQPEPAVVTVTGYRASLLSSAKDKKEAVGFQDTISAEDIGKFPDKNIAESLSRIPGVQISRDVTGEGVNVQIRGLGSSFTKVLLNNAQIAVASSGPIDGANTNREIDLDMLPTDLFTKLTVSKSPTADMIEGGAAGVVNLRSARPFDNPGTHVSYGATAQKQQIADGVGGRGSILASRTWGNTFGILAGFAVNRQKARTTGYETVGLTNANLSAAQNTSGSRNTTGGGNWTIPATVPAGAGAGLVAGTPIDQAFLLANNPGRTITQIDNAILPRLGRYMDYFGTRDKGAAIVSAEWRPLDNLHFYVDAMYSKKDDDMSRVAYTWAVRNNFEIPLNMQVDKSDCAAGCTVTSGTFANSRYFIEYGPRRDKTTLKGLNPGMEWKISPTLKLEAQANATKSTFSHEAPTIMPITADGSGLVATFNGNGGAMPSITFNQDVNNPANFVWAGGRVNIQNELRETSTKGFHSDLTWGDAKLNVRAGIAYDDIDRRIRGQDNSAAWQAAVCGNNPNVFLQGPNGAPPCDGASTPGASASALYPGYGTGYTAGQTTPLVYQGSLIPVNKLASYLVPGPYGRIVIDWDRFRKDSNYDAYNSTAPDSTSSSTGASSGYVRERSTGFYTELNGQTSVGGFPLRYNAGVRYVRTRQEVGSLNSFSDPRNATLTQNGSKYPNQTEWVYQNTTYNNTLPSATAALSLRNDLVARLALSKTMTRANPNSLRPGINFSSPSADIGTIGSPELKPYLSNNIDLGLDWYTGREGYVSLTVFQKQVKGFTVIDNRTLPFSALAAYGITYNNLIPTQQVAINSRGGPDAATVVMSQERNAGGILRVRGLEIGWVQPLDKLLPIKGFGFNETATFINQSATGEGTNGFVALNVPKKSNNFGFYYENHGYMARISHQYQQGSQSSTGNQNGIRLASLYGRSYKQADFSSSVDLEKVFDRDGWPTVTFDIVNLNKAKREGYFQFPNAAFSSYDPGRTFQLGIRGKF
ncbi:TonB-dependent receptor [Massilia sp. TW-1]|uniref:TonB-dependent receptor n=1 Tax=Telluria antibiotica TaxID=2717319 RepID=A0ABX0PJR3_9BURK|nr:TonB-dependent receptor [Telluria antibiotica]NIA56664.1 TonB-dependent receptor [Telluria antibiotica]